MESEKAKATISALELKPGDPIVLELEREPGSSEPRRELVGELLELEADAVRLRIARGRSRAILFEELDGISTEILEPAGPEDLLDE